MAASSKGEAQGAKAYSTEGCARSTTVTPHCNVTHRCFTGCHLHLGAVSQDSSQGGAAAAVWVIMVKESHADVHVHNG